MFFGMALVEDRPLVPHSRQGDCSWLRDKRFSTGQASSGCGASNLGSTNPSQPSINLKSLCLIDRKLVHRSIDAWVAICATGLSIDVVRHLGGFKLEVQVVRCSNPCTCRRAQDESAAAGLLII
mmetsp:Transcript_15019/g.27705  ORF Transcript_15019/g.27705 Transcript_15019/m.27705 type:complete len:124 (+) Transcript_15019:370-741(+)